MASTAVADPKAAFEFNPSAPEFVPQQQQPHPLLLSGLPAAGVGLDCRSLSLSGRCSSAAGPEALAEGEGGPDPDGSGAEEDGELPRLLLVPRGEAEPPVGRRRSSAARRGGAEGAGASSEKLRRQSARRATNATEAPSQVATLVVKNLAMDLEKGDVMGFLEERGAAPADVELHRDANGAFRGTAFARYSSPGQARAALERLGAFPEFGGRKARVEIQKSKALYGRKCLEAGLPQEELGVVREEIERFVADPLRSEMGLATDLSVQQRKYAHSLAERHNLVHATRQGEGGEKFVYLSKARREPLEWRKKAHSVAYNGVSHQSVDAYGARPGRRQTFPSAEAEDCCWPPGVEDLGPPGILLNDAFVAAAAAALPAGEPLCAAPGLPLPPAIAAAAAACAAANCGGLPRPAPGLELEGWGPAHLGLLPQHVTAEATGPLLAKGLLEEE